MKKQSWYHRVQQILNGVESDKQLHEKSEKCFNVASLHYQFIISDIKVILYKCGSTGNAVNRLESVISY